ncbi:hypothetical protein BGZ94_007699 [Podila epigama]|nr:hypothetical protein BGZ94_007699 [Podila epigama]
MSSTTPHASNPNSLSETLPSFEASKRPNIHDIVIVGHSALSLNAIFDDFLELITAYAKVSGSVSVSFRAYYLDPVVPFNAMTGAVFTLYLIHATQPRVFTKRPILLTRALCSRLDQVYQSAIQQKATDLVFTLNSLRKSGAFVYVADLDRANMVHETEEDRADRLDEELFIDMERRVNEQTIIPVEPIVTELYKVAKDYHLAKVGLSSVQLATQASEVLMAHLQKLKPEDMDIATAKPNLHFLHPDDDMVNSSLDRRQDKGLVERGAGRQSWDINRNTTEDSRRIGMSSPEMNILPGDDTHSTLNLPDLNCRAPLPSAFPVSMLEASEGLVSQEVEQLLRAYLHNRIHRAEYATAGGLQQNDNRFMEQSEELQTSELKRRKRHASPRKEA